MKSGIFLASVIAIFPLVSQAEQAGVISSFDNRGMMTILGCQAGTTATLEWASSLSDPIRTNWYTLGEVVVTNFSSSTEWPMFFRARGAPDTNLLDGLIAYYPFNGNANDQSGNAFNGTVSGATLTSDRFGRSSSAYYFNGSANIVIPNGMYTPTVEGLTISLWVKSDNASAMKNAVFLAPEDGECAIRCTSTNIEFAAKLNDEAYYYLRAPSDASDTHIAGVYRKNQYLNLYRNGILVATTNITNTGLWNTGFGFGSSIGSYYNVSDYFVGTIDDVRIYGRALSSNEVWNLSRLPY